MPPRIPPPSAIALAEPAKPKILCQCGSKLEVESRADFCDKCCSCESHRMADEDGQCLDCREFDWSPDMLVSHKRFGPAIIGRAMFEKCQKFCAATFDNKYGPAILTKHPDQTAHPELRKPVVSPGDVAKSPAPSRD